MVFMEFDYFVFSFFFKASFKFLLVNHSPTVKKSGHLSVVRERWEGEVRGVEEFCLA